MPPFTGTLKDGTQIHYTADREATPAELQSAFDAMSPDQRSAAVSRTGGGSPSTPSTPPDTTSQGKPEEKSLGGFMKNVVKSTGENVSNIASAVRHPIDTVGSLAKTAAGGAELLIPGEQGQEPYARALG